VTEQIPVKAIKTGATATALAEFADGDTLPASCLPDGLPATVSLPIGDVVQSLRVVRASAGSVYPVDTATEAHGAQAFGLSLQSVTTIGDDVKVQTAGVVSDGGWAWTDGAVYCGADGTLTQSPATTGWLLCVGLAVSPTSVLINLDPPIYRG
jgi:hypothetical protein